MELPIKMLPMMKEFTGLNGTFISWNAPFEISRNKDMIDWLPEFTSYIEYMNDHMFDLMNIFKQDYVDSNFQGSISIKKVLPVLCPEMNHTHKSLCYFYKTVIRHWPKVLSQKPMN